MAKIGFGRSSDDEKIEEEKIIIRNIDRGFLSMMRELGIEKKEHQRMAQLEKIIRRELLKLHKKLKKLSKKIKVREDLFRQAKVLSSERPKKSLELIDQIDALDQEIQPKAKELFESITKHSIPEIHEIYKEMDITKQNKENLRILANNLSSRLSTLMREINETSGQALKMTKQNILRVNPNLG